MALHGSANRAARQTGDYPRSYACFRRLMSSFSICSTAFITLFAFSASLSCISLPRTVGTICHDRPYLSLSQPHLPPLPPCESFSHSSSTSCCVSQFTKKDMASENLKCGPPFKAMNSCPSSWNVTVITVPFALPEILAPSWYKTYLEQLGIQYPTVRKEK